MAFLIDTDWTVQLRSEIAKIIDGTTGNTKLLKAENMAIAQIKQFLNGRYDVDKIFAPITGDTDTRDQFIVMAVIDIALYHLWSKEGTNNIPKTREIRYNDILEWLKEVQKGAKANLPEITEADNTVLGDVRIWSAHTLTDNRY